MQPILSWIVDHPETATLIATAGLSILTAVFKPRTPEEYAAMSPRVAAILKLGAAILPDLVKIAKAVKQLKSGDAGVETREPKGDK